MNNIADTSVLSKKEIIYEMLNDEDVRVFVNYCLEMLNKDYTTQEAWKHWHRSNYQF